MVDFSYDKEKILRDLGELKGEISILLQRIEKAENEIVKVETLEDAVRFEGENDLDGNLRHIEVF